MSRIVRSVLAIGTGVAALAGGLTVAVAVADEPSAPAAASAAAVAPPTAVRLRAGAGDLCLTIARASLRNGTDATASACADDAENQLFDLVPTGAGTFELRAGHSGKCLEVQSAGTKAGSVVQQWWCGQGQHQRWSMIMVDIAKESYELRPVHTATGTNRCLDIAPVGKDAGASAQLWPCNGSGAQKWRLEPVTAA
ncbi:RICIN domain-containing protein [Streptomyces lavendulocolor]|uniref:RICIN domain-containing protein n=1 Tax=Streptomyces lavendulocolor TaxID=67316 RepID=UPI003C2DB5AB